MNEAQELHEFCEGCKIVLNSSILNLPVADCCVHTFITKIKLLVPFVAVVREPLCGRRFLQSFLLARTRHRRLTALGSHAAADVNGTSLRCDAAMLPKQVRFPL